MEGKLELPKLRWLGKPMRFNLDNGPSSQLLQRVGRGWEGGRGHRREGEAWSGLVLREVMLSVASVVSPVRTILHERLFWLEKSWRFAPTPPGLPASLPHSHHPYSRGREWSCS